VGKESDGTLKNDQEEKQNSKVRKPSSINNSKEDREESICSGHFQKIDKPRSGGSMLQFMEDLVKVGQAMSPSVGYSGGILCVWDPRLFLKVNSTISDYFVMIRGEWIFNGKKMLIICIYAPQELSEKKLLWDYLIFVIDNWNGEVVIIGEFNKVRTPAERYGSIFNVQGANAFNSFISSTGLEEVPSGGCSFTWCHKSANKMSKLYRFLISEEKIRAWLKVMKDNTYIQKKILKADLAEIDLLLDKGEGDYDILNNRVYVSKSLQDIEKLESMEVAQKAKIKWAIEEMRSQNTIMKKTTIIFKVDFEKAYDSVRWDYLDDVLKNFGFGDKWRRWIQNCLKSLRGSVIVNESPTNEFQFCRGLEQGDPLYPFLFLLIMESLHLLVQRVVDANMFRGISIGVDTPKEQGTDLCGFIQKKIGNGSDTSFWEEMWRGDSIFKLLYLRLYALETCKSITVADKLGHENLVYSFRRHPRGSIEQEQLLHLMARLSGTTLVDMQDK
nr:RNA-directed DNA polymerase, eukaryota [Tanacetum cinerariifolium]